MNIILRDGYHVARKNYSTNVSSLFDFCIESHPDYGYLVKKDWCPNKITDTEIKTIQNAVDKKWRINIGDRYYKQVGVYDECDFAVIRIPDGIYEILCKYDLFDEN
jgi:hypothetical protein